MSDGHTTASGWTRAAVHELEVGEASDAREMLAAALAIDPAYEPAWLWFSTLAHNDGERRYCYDKLLQIDPDNAEIAALDSQLAEVEPVTPDELQILEPPPLPPAFGGPEISQHHRRIPFWAILAGLVLALAAIVGAFWYVQGGNDSKSPVYVAFVSDYSGDGNAYSREMEQGIQLYLQRINSRGGIHGHPVQLLSFDDGGTAESAKAIAEEVVADDRIIGVIGHRTSTLSLAASPVYQAAEIPVITSTATVDELTTGNPWYFRTIFSNADEGAFLAAYTVSVLNQKSVMLVTDQSAYGTSIKSSFTSAFFELDGTITSNATIPENATADSIEINGIVQEIQEGGDDNLTIVVGAGTQASRELIVAIKKAGLNPTIIGGDAVGSDFFLQGVAEVLSGAGVDSSTDGIQAVTPIATDSLSGDLLQASAIFYDAYGYYPSWRALSVVDSAITLVRTLGMDDFDFSAPIADQRSGLRDGLVALDSRADAIPGLLGPIYFDEDRNVERGMSMVVAEGSRFHSAPLQLRTIDQAEAVEQEDSDQLVSVGSHHFSLSRVVFTGVEMNVVRDLNVTDRTYFIDFFIWFKYLGDDDATDIQFPNLADTQTFIQTQVRTGLVDGLNYRVFRVSGLFKTDLDFRDFPFDSQVLEVKYENKTLPTSALLYAIDSDFQETPMERRLESGANSGNSILAMPNWTANSLTMTQESLGTTSNLGDPALGGAANGYEYSQVVVSTGIDREAERFLIKNLLPLALIAIITYLSLFFSFEQTAERVSFGVTGVLTGAVLLSGVTDALPDVGYTVAIEYAYYAFIALSGMCILVALLGGKLDQARQFSEMRMLNITSRVVYPLAILAVIAGYWYKFG